MLQAVIDEEAGGAGGTLALLEAGYRADAFIATEPTNFTVTVAHSKTKNLPDVVRQADIVVAAVGRPQMIKGDWIKPGATVIDVGVNRVPAPDKGEGKTRLVGDVDYGPAAAVAGAITPVPGGVGPMTIACLLANTVTTASLINGLTPPKDLTP